MIVSDAGQANITSARANLTSLFPEETASPHKLMFIHSPAETVHTHLPPASVDFTCVAMAFHYFDAPTAIRSMAATLRPGGTLAVVTYGFRLLFPGHPVLERLWYAAASKESLRLLREGSLFPAAVRGLAAAMAGLDFVPLPTELFEPGAIRMLVNVKEEEEEEEDNDRRPLYFVDEDSSCWEPAPDRVGPMDVRRYVRDKNWRREVDVEWLRGFLASCKMGFGQETWETAEWRQLEATVRNLGGRVIVEWPVAMILATRNNNPVSG